MAETTIEWTSRRLPDGGVVKGFTMNPWIGCTKVSPACANCYAERDMVRRGAVTWGPVAVGGTRVVTSADYWKGPERWARKAAPGTRPLVFCASLADVGEEWVGPLVLHSGDVLVTHPDTPNVCEPRPFMAGPAGTPPDWRERVRPHLEAGYRLTNLDDMRRSLFGLIARTAPALDWLILTKRPEALAARWDDLTRQYIRALQILAVTAPPADRGGYVRALEFLTRTGMIANVWVGTTAESQEWADVRVPALLNIPAPRHFVSVEPQVGPVDLTPWLCPPAAGARCYDGQPAGINWVIGGGESGANARAANPDWYRALRHDAVTHDVPFFFKQWGEIAPDDQVPGPVAAGRTSLPLVGSFGPDQHRYGKKVAGRTLDGVEWGEIPESVL